MKAYKLTDQNNYSFNNTLWGENITHTAQAMSPWLCSNGWIHFYTHPWIAVVMNPVHANFHLPKLWECDCSGDMIHEPLKSGCKTLTTLKTIPLPYISPEQYCIFGILMLSRFDTSKDFVSLSKQWLSGKNRSLALSQVLYDSYHFNLKEYVLTSMGYYLGRALRFYSYNNEKSPQFQIANMTDLAVQRLNFSQKDFLETMERALEYGTKI